MLLRRRGFLTAESTQAFNRFAYYYGLPLFLFYKLAGAETVSASDNLMTVALISAVALTFAISWIAAILFNQNVASRGASIQASFRGNLAFMGLPLILFLIEELPDEQKASIEAAMLLALTPVIIFFNIGSVVALVTYNQKTEKDVSIPAMALEIARNPLVWACVGGALFQLSGWELPRSIMRTCSIVGASAFPIALLGIGSQLISIPSARGWRATVVPTLIKCVVCPLIGWAVGAAIGLDEVALQVTVILCAMPTAVSSYVMAEQMNGDAALAAGAVVVSTVFSLPSLALLIWLT